MKPWITVYTCNVNNYDFVLPPLTDDPDLSFVCFTDQANRRVKGWDVRPLQSPPHITNPTLINRYHKFFPHKLGFDTEWSIYVDGNMRVLGRISRLVKDMQQSDAVMACLAHPQRNTVDEEIRACAEQRKLSADQTRVANRRYHQYVDEGMPANAKLYANKVIVRRHADPTLIAAMETWWKELLVVPRDQLSLPYAVWKTSLRMKVFPLPDYQLFSWYGHRKSGLAGLRQRLVSRQEEPFYGFVYRTLVCLKNLGKLRSWS